MTTITDHQINFYILELVEQLQKLQTHVISCIELSSKAITNNNAVFAKNEIEATNNKTKKIPDESQMQLVDKLTKCKNIITILINTKLKWIFKMDINQERSKENANNGLKETANNGLKENSGVRENENNGDTISVKHTSSNSIVDGSNITYYMRIVSSADDIVDLIGAIFIYVNTFLEICLQNRKVFNYYIHSFDCANKQSSCLECNTSLGQRLTRIKLMLNQKESIMYIFNADRHLKPISECLNQFNTIIGKIEDYRKNLLKFERQIESFESELLDCNIL